MIEHNEMTVLEKIGGQEAIDIRELLKIARGAIGGARKELYQEARERTVIAYREACRLRLN